MFFGQMACNTLSFTPDLQLHSAADYYPFGMVMPSRQFQSGSGYRFGFNGMEKDDEIKGSGNSIDFGARIYDSRLGRWLSLDPQAEKYPGWTPYRFALNNPLLFIDPDGETEYKFMVRSFAPTGSFNGPIKVVDDGRLAFSAAYASARVHHSVVFNTRQSNWGVLPKTEGQSTIVYSPGFLAGEYEPSGNYGEYFTPGGGIWGDNGTLTNFQTGYSAGNGLFKIGGLNFSPKIDVHLDVTVEEGEGFSGTYFTEFNISQEGDHFPAHEMVVEDPTGNQLLIGSSAAIGSPEKSLFGGEGNYIGTHQTKAQTDKDGNFLGVFSKDANGNDIVLSPSAYNNQQSQKPVVE